MRYFSLVTRSSRQNETLVQTLVQTYPHGEDPHDIENWRCSVHGKMVNCFSLGKEISGVCGLAPRAISSHPPLLNKTELYPCLFEKLPSNFLILISHLQSSKPMCGEVLENILWVAQSCVYHRPFSISKECHAILFSRTRRKQRRGVG